MCIPPGSRPREKRHPTVDRCLGVGDPQLELGSPSLDLEDQSSGLSAGAEATYAVVADAWAREAAQLPPRFDVSGCALKDQKAIDRGTKRRGCGTGRR